MTSNVIIMDRRKSKSNIEPIQIRGEKFLVKREKHGRKCWKHFRKKQEEKIFGK